MATERELKDRVRDQFAATAAEYVKSPGHASGNDLARMLVLASPAATDRFLDIATGGGHVARTFGPRVGSIVLADLTREMLIEARRFLSDSNLADVNGVVADAESLPFSDASFDIVTCRIAPHHFPQPGLFVNEVSRVLGPNGRFLLVDSTVAGGDAGVLYNRFEKIRDESHVRSLTIGEWTSLIQGSGLKLKHLESFRKNHDFAEWAARAKATDEQRQALIGLMRAAPSDFTNQYGVIWDGDALKAFSDEKTLFVAVK